jgi:predicted ATPase/Tfp pilus assembly protein PilF
VRGHLERAVQLYQGDLLPGFYYDWVLTERQRLLQTYLSALHRLILMYGDEKNSEPALKYARLALAADPLREESHIDLIRILGKRGEISAALREYQNLKRLLAQEFGTEPSSEAAALLETLQKNSVAVPEQTEKRLHLSPLPVPLTRFFGRSVEIERVTQLLQPQNCRLVTLIGTGGAGKTRLSLAVSNRLMDDYQGAVAFVALADLAEASVIPTMIAVALNLPEGAVAAVNLSSLAPIVEALSTRPFLLVLDNLEHLLAESTPLVRELLDRVPTLTVLATSRQRLGIEGEQEISISSLPLPTSGALLETILQSPSVQLFLDRARLARPDFMLSEANAEVVARVCARLEGIPLAIELCAAWAQMLTPAQMLEKLDRRFDLLVSRRTDITPRHRTLRAAVEYSYLQLPAEMQRLFARLSVFRGSWSLEAAVAIAADSQDTDTLILLSELTELRERSLIVAEEILADDGEAEMRYRILETLREFAGEQLSYADRTSRRQTHADYFVSLAEDARTPLVRLEMEQENLRSVLAWSLETKNLESGLRLGGALRRYWSLRGRLAEGYDWLRRLFDLVAVEGDDVSLSVAVCARAWNTLGYLAWAQGNYTTSYDAHQKALALFQEAEDKEGIGESLYFLGITCYRQDDYSAARGFLEESLSIAQERNDSAGIARVLLNLGNIAYEERRYDEADTFFQQSLVLEQGVGNQHRVANALSNRGLIAMVRKEYKKAEDLFQQALTLSQALADSFSAASFTMNLGTVARLQNQEERAWSVLKTGLKLASEVGNKHIISHYLLQLGLLLFAAGRTARGVFLLAAAQHVFGSIAGPREVTPPEESEQAITEAQSLLGEARVQELVERARKEPLGQILTEVLAWENDTNDDIKLEKKS